MVENSVPGDLTGISARKLETLGYHTALLFDNGFSHFDTIHERV